MNETALVVFDAECILCNRSVQWIMARDKKLTFSFTSMQSAYYTNLISEQGIEATPNSLQLITSKLVYTKSTAVLKICGRLPYPYKAIAIFQLIPVFIRDAIYIFVARNRFRIFGKQEKCLLPNHLKHKVYV
jgi:predicted DCC family thiol-disulfide oxidoreductase YuxK